MSQEWNNTAGDNPQQQPSSQPATTYRPQTTSTTPAGRPQRNNTWIFMGIIAVLLGACIYLFVSRKNVQQQASNLRDTVQVTVAAKENLNTEYQAAIARLDQLNTTNSELNNEIKDKDGELQKMRAELQGIMSKQRRTESDNAKARALIAKLNSKVASYEERITKLEGENKQLTAANTTLTVEKQKVAEENTGLQRQVKLGAVLHASNIRMEAINLKRHGSKEVETSKAKRADMLRVIFDIDENRIAESGTKEVLLRITGPDGRLLSNAAYGSGVTTADDGQQLSYTLSKQVSLVQNTPVKNVVVDWKQDSDYQRGTYNIDLYNAGFRIGGGSVTLR
jgi:predicted nuclease with TOPRIM domain